MGPILKIKVKCHRCNEEIDKLDARPMESNGPTKQYECFPCFKKYNLSDSPRVKKRTSSGNGKYDLFCEKCRYKFSSRKIVCPYCDKSDHLIKSPDNILELLDSS